MRLVASRFLEEGDLEALERATTNREEVLRSVAVRGLAAIRDYSVGGTVERTGLAVAVSREI